MQQWNVYLTSLSGKQHRSAFISGLTVALTAATRFEKSSEAESTISAPQAPNASSTQRRPTQGPCIPTEPRHATKAGCTPSHKPSIAITVRQQHKPQDVQLSGGARMAPPTSGAKWHGAHGSFHTVQSAPRTSRHSQSNLTPWVPRPPQGLTCSLGPIHARQPACRQPLCKNSEIGRAHV